MTLSLAMIAKGGLKDLKRLHPLIRGQVDEWVVVVPPGDKAIPFLKKVGAKVIEKDFTIPIEGEVREKMSDYGVEVPEDYRIFQFASARNESFANATGDYILWLDCDDTPVGLKGLKKLIEDTEVECYDALYDYSKDNEGNAISDHWRERVIQNNGRWEWKGAKLGLIHETIVPKDNYFPKKLEVDPETFRVEHYSDHHDESSLRNHIALLYEYIKTDGADARTTYYLGIEFFNRKMYEMCIQIMQEYVKVGGWDEERYRAWIRMAEAYHQLGDKESSRNAYLNAQKELPSYPDAYLGMGESFYSSEIYDKAIEYILTGMGKPIPKTKSAIDMVKYTFRAMTFLALCYMKLGKNKEAYGWFTKAKKSNPKHPWVIKYEDLFEEIKDLDDYVRSFVRLGQISQKRYKKSLGKLADAIPDDLINQEILLDFKRRYSTPKIWGENSIVYFCSQAFEDWGHDSLERGCGGSEEAVIHLTKRWAKMGYEVTVFNNCEKEGKFEGVTWQRFEKFNPRDIFNILIAWRNNPFLEPKVATKKFIDVHDVPSLKYFPAETLKDVTLMVKSKYHRSLFPDLKDDNFAIVPNGIDLEQFSKATKYKNKMVWTSSLDRGLEYLLEMWSDIKKEVPDATLDVYYGFNLFDVSARAKTAEGQKWKAKVVKLLDQEGINFIGRVGTHDIAEAYKGADIWAYPTDFPEISCITAMKAQAAGAIPVCTDYAALKETVKHGVIIPGNGADPKVQEKFKKELISLMKDEKRKEQIRSKMNVDEYSWSIIAEEWSKLF